ncbi:ribosome biogenesis GTPase [Alteribacillus persepolensis]|uniref:Small ribosomal subunit biogenesis GTPase RsgA n=1 Tax=Alteribacillus persepolensis TaxID=568899 RepID=A0A1G7YJL3_9BACI|nr:ribosome small subunit-dependent GTPase A [Alteribacillus persepolensis]SDG96429.1 ribosome biogenesis GTPase [Alteribacillus persepolensis]
MDEGIIIKSLSGFYYVENENGVFQCRGRGLFRKQKIKPLVGDYVFFEAEQKEEGYIYEIKERRNEINRPPVANVDQALLVFSAEEPAFSTLLLDRFLVHMESLDIWPVIIINKFDLAAQKREQELLECQHDYQVMGYPFVFVSSKNNQGMEEIKPWLEQKVSIAAGQSGVGKSTLLNALDPSLELETAEISTHLGRGKHTTRHVELHSVHGGWVADTPGFSSLDFQAVHEEDLDVCFPEMKDRLAQCKFRGCTHRKEPGCAVKQAVEDENIPSYRYNHYLQFYEEIHAQRRY